MNEGLNTNWKLCPTRPKRRWCSAGLSLLHHKVEAAQSLSGSQMSDLQTSKQGRRNAARREGRWEHRQEAQLEMTAVPGAKGMSSVCVCARALCQQQALSLERASTWRATSTTPPSQEDMDSRIHRPGAPLPQPHQPEPSPAHCPWH